MHWQVEKLGDTWLNKIMRTTTVNQNGHASMVDKTIEAESVSGRDASHSVKANMREKWGEVKGLRGQGFCGVRGDIYWGRGLVRISDKQ